MTPRPIDGPTNRGQGAPEGADTCLVTTKRTESLDERLRRKFGFKRSVAVVAAVAAALLASSLALAASGGSSTSDSSADRWSRYLADEATCPGSSSTSSPFAAEVRAMTCLINHARAAHGLPRLRTSPVLVVAARRKGEAIQRCNAFEHAPCGGKPSDVAVRAGYSGRFAENLYLGEGNFGSPREALQEWLSSGPHRAQVLSPKWRVQSLYAARVAELDGFVDATLWVAQFGDR